MHVRDWVHTLSTPSLLSGTHLWQSLCNEAQAPMVAAAWLRAPTDQQRFLLVTADHERALQWQARLGILGIPPSAIRHLPSGQSTLFDDGAPERFALSERSGALATLISGEPCIILATAQAALERCPTPETFAASIFQLSVNSEIAVEVLIQRLVHMGYEREDPVRRPGGFSQRGGLVDVFPAGAELPTRIEFFGDSVESLRRFDPDSQRSILPVESVFVAPARNVLLLVPNPEVSEIALQMADSQSKQLNIDAKENLLNLVKNDAELIRKGVYFDRVELYAPLIESQSSCVLDFAKSATVILEEPFELEARADSAQEGIRQALQHRHEQGELLLIEANEFLLDHARLGQANQIVAMTSLGGAPNWLKTNDEIEFEMNSLASYRGQADSLSKAISNWQKKGVTIAVATDQPSRASEVLKNTGLAISEAGDDWQKQQSFWMRGNLAGGFIDQQNKRVLLTDAELFGVKRLRLPQRRFNEGAAIASVLDLKPGDFVVHIQFGIGRYRGLVVREVDGVNKEFLHIEYQQPDKLLVPTDQLDRIQKYLSPTEGAPQLHRITGGDWQRTLKNAKKGAEDLARDLIRIYAKRASQTRPAYGEDSPWQSEMEATFQWVETPSQVKTIEEIKNDLNAKYPMDRLVCGDVGFGKTEVAIRAAFKVAQSGQQVAVLCPTTVLSDQHFETFKERLAPYPIEIHVLNRFRKAKERSNSLKGIADGTVNIVIGTHALLQNAVKFKNLGLVVVDEEQRFGVKHKERLKDLRATADFLTLTATPIPRTLSMAMMDIRQMSLINDPPPGRMPIRTFVRPFSDQMVREALLRELARGGQVFYVFNRIDGIQHTAERIRKLVPNASIAVAHGQMTADELEPIMTAFFHHEIDVLVSTTIVENGIDNSNANTLIIDGADKLGLAQLYQLRGRVGRSDRQAYAYMFYRSGKHMTENAMERLRALQEFSELGSGYSLAFRDLQIRGAGELLGSKQHGVMATVGYEMYVHLINQAVQQLRNAMQKGGETEARMTEVHLNPTEIIADLPAFEIPAGAFLPTTYIPDQNQRLFIYKRLMEARSSEQVAEVKEELLDRYGKLPLPAESAVRLVLLRIFAAELGIRKVDSHAGRIFAYFKPGKEMPAKVVHQLMRTYPGRKFRPDMAEFDLNADAVESTGAMLDLLGRLIAEARIPKPSGTTAIV